MLSFHQHLCIHRPSSTTSSHASSTTLSTITNVTITNTVSTLLCLSYITLTVGAMSSHPGACPIIGESAGQLTFPPLVLLQKQKQQRLA